MNPKVSIELDTSQWWAAVSCLRGNVDSMPKLADHLVRSISKPCKSEDLQEVMDDALLELDAL